MPRLICLDGLRGVLALYVMLSHTLPFAPMPAWLAWPFSHGGAAVDIFFILSGLVIVQSLASYGHQSSPFLIARVARIYPVFLPVFAFAVLVQPLDTGFTQMPWVAPDSQARDIWSSGWPNDWLIGLAAHLVMLHGLIPDHLVPNAWVSFLGAAWSLSTEWQFYLLVVLIGERLGSGRDGLARLSWLFLAIALAGTSWQWAGPETWQFSRAFLPNKAQYFALGIAGAVLVQRQAAGLPLYLVVLLATLVVCAAQGGVEKLLAPLMWTGCLGAQLWPDWRPMRPLAALLQTRAAVWLGAVSYCIYLVNEPVQKLLGVVLAWFAQGDALLFSLFWLPGAVALPLLASWWLHVRIEVPALRWGKAAARRAMAGPAVTPIIAG